MAFTDIENWYDKYKDFPYKHLSDDPVKGIDCFNLIKYVYKKELNIDIPYSTKDFCDNKDEDWYNQISANLFNQFRNPKWGWVEVAKKDRKPFDVVTISIGSTNVVNHCALLVSTKSILNIMIGHKSWIAPYGNWYLNFTDGVYRWKNLIT